MITRLRPGSILRNLAVIVIALVWLVPTYLIIVNASTPVTSYDGSPTWIPQGFALLENIRTGLGQSEFTTGLMNSTLYALVGAGITVLIVSAAAYSAVVMPLKRPKLWFWIIYSGTLLPLQAFLVPIFVSSSQVGLYDSRLLLLIVYVAVCIPFGFFVARNYTVTIAIEIAQAAKVDGAGWFRTYWSIFLPLMRPALLAAFIFQANYIWNELFFGLSLVVSPENRPIMAAVASLQGQGSVIGQPVILASALLVSLPTLLIFLVFQKYFVAGLSTGL